MGAKDTPTKRAFRMASMTAGVTGSYLGYLAQSAFLGGEGRKAKLKVTHTKAARRVSDELIGLRGPAMKIGQMLSLQAGLLPEETLAQLSALQMSAPGMHPSLARAQFKAGLGAYPEDVFTRFEPEPFAAASLGQVHRATTRDGERVAVKIQYPGIGEAITSDFKLFRTAAAASRVFPGFIVKEFETHIHAETDYRQEAANIDLFREKLEPLEFVTVPAVYPKYSGDRVLTMSLLDGKHLDAWLATKPSQRARDALAARLVELYFFQVLRVRVLHADPHWGNYLFRPDGSVGLIDFGCVKRLDSAFVANLRGVFLNPADTQSPEIRRLLEERYAGAGSRLSPRVSRALGRFSENFFRKIYPPEPENDHIPFDFSDSQFLRDYVRESANLLRAKGALPGYVMMGRAETGLYHTLHRLRARVHMSAILRRQLNA